MDIYVLHLLKNSCVILLQLGLSYNPHEQQLWLVVLSCFNFSLKFNRSDTGTVLSMLHDGWFMWTGDVFVKQFCTSNRLVERLLNHTGAQFLVSSCWTKESTAGLVFNPVTSLKNFLAGISVMIASSFPHFHCGNQFLCPRNTNMAAIGCDT